MTELTDLVITIVTIVLPFVIGILSREPWYQKAKMKLSESRQLLDDIDDAVYDDKVTEAEFRKAWDSARRLIQKE